MFIAFLFTLYLIGIPFTIGLLGEKCSRIDWVLSILFGLGSWLSAAMFFGAMIAMSVGCKAYEAGRWLSDKAGDIFFD